MLNGIIRFSIQWYDSTEDNVITLLNGMIRLRLMLFVCTALSTEDIFISLFNSMIRLTIKSCLYSGMIRLRIKLSIQHCDSNATLSYTVI
jgi:hypothetical protein